ncbi:MAG: universal stress protein [Desulfobacterales bacterium]|nr:MAG: universal stress protein [Desulfobacterales bacterium]
MVPEFKKILFTTDLSKSARYAFDYAVSLAHRYGARITILHVMEEVSPAASVHLRDFLGQEKWQQLEDSHKEEARQILIGKKREAMLIREALGEFCDQAQKDLTEAEFTMDEIVVTRGNVVDEILNEAKERGCDLIVMGYHVRGRLEETFLGSTTRRVLRRSALPVMLVRLTE